MYQYHATAKKKPKKRISCFNSRVVTMVAWFTVVVEANCIRQPVSLLKRGKQQGNYLSDCLIQLASDTNMQPLCG